MKRVLVVEDDPHNALLLKLLERRGGFTVEVTESAPRVIEVLRGGGADLVILDVSLVNTTWEGRAINGIELCQLLKSDRTIAPVPIVLATAHAMRGDAENFVEKSGADGYVSKPILDHAAFVAEMLKMLGEEAA
jgi:CheY-like chemotaxis protein